MNAEVVIEIGQVHDRQAAQMINLKTTVLYLLLSGGMSQIKKVIHFCCSNHSRHCYELVLVPIQSSFYTTAPSLTKTSPVLSI